MLRIFLILILAFSPFVLLAQDTNDDFNSQSSNLPQLSISVDPMGFLFFGPTLDLGVGITPNTAVTVHTRFVPLGLISNKVKTDGDGENLGEFTGMGFGAGVIHFINDGGSGLYVGGKLEYAKFVTTYDLGDMWEWYEEGNNYIFMINGGIRKSLTPIIYVNAGVAVGAIYTDYRWDYSDASVGVNDPEVRDGTTFFPGGLLELSVGLKIK